MDCCVVFIEYCSLHILEAMFVTSVRIGKIIMQGYYRLNTTMLSDTYKYVNYMFRPLWPSSGWIQHQKKKKLHNTTRSFIH